MEIAFRKEDMAEAMKAVGRAVGNSRIPILANLLISTACDPLPGFLKTEENSRIYLAATDLEIGIRTSIPGRVMESGAVTIPARKFADMVREMPGPDIHLATTSADSAKIDCGSARFMLAALPADEFPPLIPEAEPEQPELIGAEDKALSSISVDSDALDGMIRKTSFAASREDMQHFLNGIHLSLKKGDGADCTVKMAATDGRRMAVATSKADGDTVGDMSAIIPIKSAERLRNMLQSNVTLERSEGSDAVRISLHESRIVFDTGSTILASRLVEGDYPDYEKFIPAESSIRLIIETQRLLAVARRVGTMANPKLPGVKLEVADDVLKISSSSPESGEACEEMPVRKEGGNITIGLNIRYLTDALKVVGAEEIMMGMENPLKPVVLKPAGDDGYLYLFMPMRL